MMRQFAPRGVWRLLAMAWAGAALIPAASAQGTSSTGPMSTMTDSSGRFNPFANPYANPYINPLATQQNLDGTSNALYFLSAGQYYKQRMAQEKALMDSARDRRRSSATVAPQPATNPRPRSAFNDGTRDYYGRRGRYFPS